MKRGLIGYVLCLAAVGLLVFPFIQDGLRSLTAGAQWQPASINKTVPMPLTILFVLGPVIAFIIALLRWARSRAPGQARWIGARTVLVVAIVAIYGGAMLTVDKARAVWDAHTRELLGQLHIGMTRAQVEQAFTAAAPLTGMQPPGSPSDINRDDFGRGYDQGFGSDDMTGYGVHLHYAPGDKLQQVSYETSHYLEDHYDRCEILMEVPARPGKQYPYSCVKK